MVKINDAHLEEKESESLRVIIALGILATVFSALAILPNGVVLVFKSTLSVSGVFSFFFIMTTGSKLKYKNQGEVADFTFTEKFRNACFDNCIDTYGYNFVIISAYFLAYAIGWRDFSRFDTKLWIGYAISGVVFIIFTTLTRVFKNREIRKNQ